jgi:hypothetical protein
MAGTFPVVYWAVSSKCHCEEPRSEATTQSSWIATARFAGLAMTGHFEDTP